MLRTIIITTMVSLAAWWTYFLRSQFMSHELELEARNQEISDLHENLEDRDAEILTQQATIDTLENHLAEARRRVKELEISLWLLKVNHRLARIEVVEQGPDPEDPSKIVTRVLFVELDEKGRPVGIEREINVQGKVLYIEGLVIKFNDTYVEAGDYLRGTSVAIFKRVFSENQAPSEGVEIDRPRMHPLPHRNDNLPDPYYEDLWERFWDYANDPDLAAEKGVRAMHGEAPSIELRPGKTYRVELRSSGGLSIRPE